MEEFVLYRIKSDKWCIIRARMTDKLEIIVVVGLVIIITAVFYN